MISAGKDELLKIDLQQSFEQNLKFIEDKFPTQNDKINIKSGEISELIRKFPESRIDSIRIEKDKEMKAIFEEVIQNEDLKMA